MKTKTVTVGIVIPAGFRWIACQPWGQWLVFRLRPKVVKQYAHQEGDYIPEYWQSNAEELTLVDLDHMRYPQASAKHWRESLRPV